ncbi:hypothetical protein Syun_009704 [Stephania yunnanensis]|uniref:Uncharacterized protein n=1 Tax=Stephania yunnanensis TaxID=152371 RepID=A0AAP0KHN1_9MAGN
MGSFSIKPSLPYLHFISYPLSFDDLALFTHLCLQSFVSLTQPWSLSAFFVFVLSRFSPSTVFLFHNEVLARDMNELGTVKSWMISLIENLLKYVKDEETCEAS